MTNKSAKFETIKAFLPPSPEHARERTSIRTHSTESRLVIGPSNIQFGEVFVCIFSARNFTGCGSEGVNIHGSGVLISPFGCCMAGAT